MATGTKVITREESYEFVWSTPLLEVPERFDVSGSYLARVCTELRVPRPEWSQAALDRLRLARDIVGTQDPLDSFRWWKTSLERYVPLSLRAARSPLVDEPHGNGDNDEDARCVVRRS